ncbi:MAG: ChbG/HpnK family deacetylase [Gammaproteobacteria bacterium]|jgi:predicted glycoside hydrolase/deacetylase ChbG (UPF0249 family)
MIESRRITLCADDFALDRATSSAVLELVAERRISAVSCLTESPLWKDSGRQLRRHRNAVLTGLHFNLTESFGCRRASLGGTILASVTRRLDPEQTSRDLRQQIDRFTDVVGALPDFIDGHQHVHAFPTIAPVVRRVAADASPHAPIPVRSVSDCFGETDTPLKRTVIRRLAALGDREASDLRSTALNTGFTGIYSLGKRANFARFLDEWLAAAPDRALVMCHPSAALRGKTASGRAEEFRFLCSAACSGLFTGHEIRFLQRDEIDGGTASRPPAIAPVQSAAIGV